VWRAVVLGLAVFTICQLFSPSLASAQDSKGQWANSPRWGWGDVAPYTGVAPPDGGDCVVDVVDLQSMAVRWGTFYGLLYYHQDFDLEPDIRDGISNNDDDYDIDIKDLQIAWGRSDAACVMFWDPNLSMGEYSYKDSTPTGPGTACTETAKDPPGSTYYKDPIGVLFYGNATASRLEQEAQQHGYPTIEHDDEQRFWEVGRCTFEDVDAREDRPWTCGGPVGDPCESWHFRAEVGADPREWGTWGGHVNWGTFAVATPHFDDDDQFCGHFVPQVFPSRKSFTPASAALGSKPARG
jgi:hypothetical protein